MNRQRLDSPLVYVGAHNVYYVKLPVKVLYFTIHIHTQINQYVVISDFPPVSVEKFNLCSVIVRRMVVKDFRTYSCAADSPRILSISRVGVMPDVPL